MSLAVEGVGPFDTVFDRVMTTMRIGHWGEISIASVILREYNDSAISLNHDDAVKIGMLDSTPCKRS